MKKEIVLLLLVFSLSGCGTTEVIDRGERQLPAQVVTEPPNTQPPETMASTEPENADYILNTSSRKFHRPSCAGVEEMKDKNKLDFIGDRQDVIEMGYAPCQNCRP